jgi:hypothetical protein
MKNPMKIRFLYARISLFTLLQCLNVGLQCLDVSLQCLRASLQRLDAGLQWLDVSLQLLNVGLQCLNVSLQCHDVSLHRHDVNGPKGTSVLQNAVFGLERPFLLFGSLAKDNFLPGYSSFRAS